MPNMIHRFQRELQSRNVLRVIIVYAASSFVILEVVDIITGPFGLPGWTLKFIAVMLAAGLLVALVFSLLYDIHPEKGIPETGPEEKDGSEAGPPTL